MDQIPSVSVDELEAALESGAVLFDVRQPDEYLDGHVAGGVLVPLGEVADRVDEFPTSGRAYVICRSGGRSATACGALRAAGVDAINVEGGTLAWLSSGRDVVVGEQPG